LPQRTQSRSANRLRDRICVAVCAGDVAQCDASHDVLRRAPSRRQAVGGGIDCDPRLHQHGKALGPAQRVRRLQQIEDAGRGQALDRRQARQPARREPGCVAASRWDLKPC
jgi:hypothetical protein